MKNKLGLPEWLLEVVEKTRNQYDPGEKTDYSATSLLVPPMIYTLQKEHRPEEDVRDALPAFFGSCVHDKIEEYLKQNPRYIVEERLYHEFHIPEAPGEQKTFVISAQIDVFDKETGELSDHKFSKVSSFQWSKDEHEFQLSLQCYLMKKKYGDVVKSIHINGLGKDWSLYSTARDNNYPQSAYIRVDYPQWADEDVEQAVKTKILEKEFAKIGQIRICDESERWARPTLWKVKRKGRKSALRNLNSEEEANEFLANIPKPTGTEYIEKVEGENIRCEWYCNVREHCSFYQEKYENG